MLYKPIRIILLIETVLLYCSKTEYRYVVNTRLLITDDDDVQMKFFGHPDFG